MKIQRCPHLGSNREGVSSITCEPVKSFMFEVSNIMRQVRFRFQNIFQRGHASFAMVLTVAKAKATVANCGQLLRRTEAFGGGASKTPALGHQSRVCRETCQPAEGVAPLHLATYALALEQDAEAIEHEGELVFPAIIKRSERLLVRVSDDGARNIARKVLIDRDANDSRSQIGAWRARAEELRAAADRFVIPTARDALRRAAGNYDVLADDAEAPTKRAPA